MVPYEMYKQAWERAESIESEYKALKTAHACQRSLKRDHFGSKMVPFD